MSASYAELELSREELDAMPGPVVVNFGTDWCGYCQAAEPLVEQAFSAHPEIRHIKVEDGKGRRLGRSFGVKLWPTLVFLRDGEEVARVVRPIDATQVSEGLVKIAPAR